MNGADFAEIIRLVCPHCRAGREVRQRDDTREWVHDLLADGTRGHTACWATGFRNSRFAEVARG